MSQLGNTLAQALQRNHELLSTLAQTDYASGALKQNTSYISDLNSQIKSTDDELAKLHKVTESERKDHVSYRDSKVKRFAYKLGGQKSKDKFSAKEQKEEREFLEAWQKEREATERREELSAALSHAEHDKTHFEQDTQRHDTAQSELDQMYASIFSGPTPEVPGEDQMEQAVNQSRDYNSQMQQVLGNEKQAVAALRQADKYMSQAGASMARALQWSSYDMMGGGMFADMEERESLSQAQSWVTQANYNLVEARKLQPAINELSGVQFPHGHGISDVLFDNIFSDMAQHDRIIECDLQIKRAISELQAQVQQQQQRFNEAKTRSKQAADALEDARKELQRIRAEAFERLAGSSGNAQWNAPSGGWNAPPEGWNAPAEPWSGYQENPPTYDGRIS